MDMVSIDSLLEFNEKVNDLETALITVNGFQYIYFKNHNRLIALDNDSGDLELNEQSKWFNKLEHIYSLSHVWSKDKFDFRKDLI